MIRKKGQYKVDLRTAMHAGDGTVKIEHIWIPGEELKSPAARLCALLTLEPGASIGFHEHPVEEEVFFVISGKAEADDNGKTVVLEPGDSLLTGGCGHAVRCCSQEPLKMLAMITKF